MVAREVGGMCSMAIAAAGASACMTLCSLVTTLQIPYYRLAGSAELFMAAGLAVVIIMKGDVKKVQAHEWKWIVLRGAFGSASAILAWAAVAVGAPTGDASALGSVNVVVAALLGRAFLGEPLSVLHILALISSLFGAVLVTKPEAIMGTPHSGSNAAWFGHALALGAGLCSGGLFIASRKSQGISPLLMYFSVSLQEGLCLLAMPSIGLVQDGPLEPLVANPFLGLAWFTSLLFLLALCIFTISLGSQMCPAAASSTIFTSVSMSLGYVAQSVIHRQRPDAVTEAGAALMLLAVALIAVARWCQSKAATARELQTVLLPEGSEELDDANLATTKIESLATFIAAEFSGLADSSKSIRQRRVFLSAVESLPTTSA